MNYLAHAVFADGPDEVIFGSLVADMLRRTSTATLPQGIRDGMRLHMGLDSFFDREESLAPCRRQLYGIVRHFSNPVFDILGD